MKTGQVLVLNKSFFPLRTESVQETFVRMFGNAYLGLDIEFSIEDGVQNTEKVEYINVTKDIDEWLNLPIRDCDDYITTASRQIRVPKIVVCASYNKIKYPKVVFPTNKNIFKRDNYTCGYTGKKLQKHELSMDHIVPKDLGGKDTWENLITCDRELNGRKSNKTLAESGLKLLWKPTKPKNGLVFDNVQDEWKPFVGNIIG